MAWTKILNTGDSPTELTGTAYRTLYLGVAGAVAELAHGALNTVLTSGGVSADPTWATPSAGAHALDAGQSDVVITTPADDEVLAYDGIGDWINQTAAEAGLMAIGDAPTAHLLGAHTTDTLANLNAKVTDATLDDSSDTRIPTASSVGNSQMDNAATDIALAQLILTPAVSGTGTTEGTLFYDSDDDHLYVYVV